MIINKLKRIMTEPQSKQSYPSYPPLPSPKMLSPRSPQHLFIPRQPHIARTNSNSKTFKKTSVDKSIKEKEIQRQLKYAKPTKIESPFQGSFFNSQGNVPSAFFPPQLEDSQETVQRVRTYSRQKSNRGYSKKQINGERGDSTKHFDILSGVSAANPQRRSGAIDKNEEYYVYWKNKAHQYLQSNIKLMEDIRRLTRDNEQLKELIQNLKAKQKFQADKNVNDIGVSEKELHNEIRKVSVHYIDKIESMEKQLKKKQIVISSYEAKLGELNARITGDNERIKLMSKMKGDFERLSGELRETKQQVRYNQSGGYEVDRGKTGKFQTFGSGYLSPTKK